MSDTVLGAGIRLTDTPFPVAFTFLLGEKVHRHSSHAVWKVWRGQGYDREGAGWPSAGQSFEQWDVEGSALLGESD